MNRRYLLILAASSLAAVVWPALAAAASPGRRRLAVLLFDNPESWHFLAPELRKELAALGWVEGTNLEVEWHFANGDAARLQRLASQVARSGVDAILTRGTPATRALQQATQTIPIVTGTGDPVGAGFARTYAYPGGNITGLSYASVETFRKQIELLKAMVPGLSRLIIVMKADRLPFVRELTGSLSRAAQEFGLATQLVFVAEIAELHTALQPGRPPGTTAAFVFGLGSGGGIAPKEVADIALRQRMPTVFEYSLYVEAGGLMSYRLDWENQTQRTAAHLDKLFRGARPAQIPFELPTRSKFVINRSTARMLGLEIPRAVLMRADEVIE